jgi:antitoxin (DNA-binding transcriptional repressor) of toxin-antitoxin stability system
MNYDKNMKTLQVAEAKIHFSTVLKDVGAGNEVAILYGKKKETIAVIIPYKTWKKTKKRELGTLKGKAKIRFSPDFSMTDEELIKNDFIFMSIDGKMELYKKDGLKVIY